MENYNAIDWYVWDSTFTGNYIGVTNIFGAGYFHVYGSLFQASTRADIEIGPVGFYSIRQNFSIASKVFLLGDVVGSASAEITLQSNTILDAVGTPIAVYSPGTVLMFDNVIRSSAGQVGPLAIVQDTLSNSPGGLVAIGNTVTVNNWYSVPVAGSNVTDLDNQIVARSTVSPVTPVMPGALPNLNRPIYEVAAGTNADGIQQAIDTAVALNGQRPVVHLPAANGMNVCSSS